MIQGRGDRDFSDDDVEVATRIQPMLMVLSRHCQVLGELDRRALSIAGGGLLTGRKLVVLRLLAQGLTGEQVAEKLVLSSETVKTHIRNAMAKLEASTRSTSPSGSKRPCLRRTASSIIARSGVNLSFCSCR